MKTIKMKNPKGNAVVIKEDRSGDVKIEIMNGYHAGEVWHSFFQTIDEVIDLWKESGYEIEE